MENKTTFTIKLDENKIKGKVDNPQIGLFISHEYKKILNPYVPRSTGILMDNVRYEPFKVHYLEPYAHYMYRGLLAVDPVTKKGAFYSPKYGFWSRPGVKKEMTDTPLKYNTQINPLATKRWDKAAVSAGQLNKLYDSINAYLRRF